ncbi:RIP metalloprotease RseP [Paenibacillus sp. NEAU-GSW1]|uniref:RIP metalloprotease RseP n=1 Tax=Paenibacillus sp. NEAU-GSW1 TaxID=2682486 RepID=UPI0012E1ACF0|nr:RIP metalloprotease RseP [Paenibacillus sp. NEAU-GSW1]MUT66391.1 RIP metalloprotease RseP [Paenibacillus sp. NEAU-GSW1]
METIQVVFLTVLVFFVIVTIHEWGHYYFAKRAGILVREFAIGFGPKLFSIKRGETRFTLRLVPAGGFVRMAGEDPEIVDVSEGQTVALRVKDDKVTRIYLDRLDERSGVVRGEVTAIDLERDLFVSLDLDGEIERFRVHPQALMISKGKETQIAPIDRQFGSKSVGARAMAIFAGPMMNFILAFVLFAVCVQMAGVPKENPDKLFVGSITDKSPASGSDLKRGDTIFAVNGTPIGGNFKLMVDIINKSKDTAVKFDIIREGVKHSVNITPAFDKESQSYRVGISADPQTRPATFMETFTIAGKQMKVWTINIFEGFKKIITAQFKLSDIGGPVRTAQYTSQFAAEGIDKLTFWTAILSLYLGIFNLMPIPALDGSRLIFIGIEAVRGRPVNPNRESMVHFIGFALIMLLMVVVTFNDILLLVRGEQ